MEIEIWNCDEDDTDDATVSTIIDDVCVDYYFNDEDDDGVNFFPCFTHMDFIIVTIISNS